MTPFTFLRVLATIVLVTVATAAFAERAHAGAGMETILQDDAQLLHQSDEQVDANMARIRELGVDRVRLTAGWSTIAPAADSPVRPDFDAADPAAYRPHVWDNLDRAVRLAVAHGLEVDIDVAFWAPQWATSDAAPGRARTDIDVADYARFATAVGRRYSGTFTPEDESAEPVPEPSSDSTWLAQLLGGGRAAPRPASVRREPLPRVGMFTIWNEPNLKGFLEPQWVHRGGVWLPASPHSYRRMAAAGYAAIKAVDPGMQVLIGGTSSGGRRRGNAGSVTPLRFLREMACVDESLRPLDREECRDYKPLQGDGWAHHPYSLAKKPGEPAREREHVTISDLDRLTSLLGKLAARGRISARLKNVWLTEFGYETNDEVAGKPFSAAQQARLLAWSEYLAWRNPHVRSHAQFLLRDIATQAAVAAAGGRRADGSWQSGLYFEDGRAKPAAATFPFTVWSQMSPTDRRARTAGARTALVWAHLRTATGPTPVRIEHGGWSRQATTDAHGVLELRVPYVGGVRYRLSVQGGPQMHVRPMAVRPPRRARTGGRVP